MQKNMGGFLFELKLLCGNYAYFSTITLGDKGSEKGREFRKPSLMKFSVQEKLKLLGHPSRMITNADELKDWLYIKGWAIVPNQVAYSLMPQWLKSKECIRSPLGIYTDIEITSPSALSRSARGARRNFILERDKKSCVNCGNTEELTMQHVLPYSLGGESSTRNLVTLCNHCNREFGTKYIPDLYELVNLHYGYDPSLIKTSIDDSNNFYQASFLSGNLMQTRCEVW